MPDPTRLDALAPLIDDAEITRIGDRGCYAIRLGRLDEDDLRNIAKAQRDATVRALVADLRAEADRLRLCGLSVSDDYAASVLASEADRYDALLPEPPAGGDRG